MNFDELDKMGVDFTLTTGKEPRVVPQSIPDSLSKEDRKKQKINEATEKAAHWLALGNAASERGEDEKAERHYDRAQKWQDKMNEMLRDRWPTY